MFEAKVGSFQTITWCYFIPAIPCCWEIQTLLYIHMQKEFEDFSNNIKVEMVKADFSFSIDMSDLLEKVENLFIADDEHFLTFPFSEKKNIFLTSPLIGLMRSGKIEPITSMGVNSSLQPANTLEGLGEVNITLQMAAKHHPDQTFDPPIWKAQM